MGSTKSELARCIYEQGDALVRLARAIHADPEIAFSEHRSSARLVDFLCDNGSEIRSGVCGLATAFAASRGTGALHLMLCAEYDALDDGVGHGSGRHLVAGAAAGAAIGLAPFVDMLGLTVTVLGTPGSELLGLRDPPADHVRAGKTALLDGGAFDGAHAVLMLVPTAAFSGFAPSRARARSRARLRTHGRAAPDPDLPRLRADLLRVAAASGARSASCELAPSEDAREIGVDVRLSGATLRDVRRAVRAVRLALRSAAAAAGTTLRITEYEPDRELRQDAPLRRAFARNAAALGLAAEASAPQRAFSTDLGNVSARIPVIAPMIALGGTAEIGTREFAALADTDDAYREMLHAAVALARTALDAASEPDLRSHLLRTRDATASAR